jgi:hypothetical protein
LPISAGLRFAINYGAALAPTVQLEGAIAGGRDERSGRLR